MRGTLATLCRHGIHQHRTRIGGEPARHVEADRFNRRPAVAKLDAQRIGVTSILRQLTLMVLGNAVSREFERCQRLSRTTGDSRLDLGSRDR